MTHSGRGCIAKVRLARERVNSVRFYVCDRNARESEMKRSMLATLTFLGTVTSAQAQEPEAQPASLMKAPEVFARMRGRSG